MMVPGADGVVGRLADQDERLAVAVAMMSATTIELVRSVTAPMSLKRQLDWPVELIERLWVQPGVQRLHRGARCGCPA